MSSPDEMSPIEEQISNLLISKELCDITVIVGQDNTCFQSHKLLLSLASEVFRAMLYGPMAKENSEIKLPKDDPRIFGIFLEYIYTNKLDVKTIKDAISALFFADKYIINYMKKDILTYFQKNLSVDCVLEVYEAAVTLEYDQLIKKCWQYFDKNLSKVIKHESFQTAKLEIILNIISKDILSLDSELDVYNAVIQWGKQQVSKYGRLREKIFPLLQQVRFISMTYSELSGLPCHDSILTERELVEIFKQKHIYTEDDSIIQKPWKQERIFQFLSSCYRNSECDKYLKEIESGCSIIIEETFHSNLHDLNVWGVSFQLNLKLESTKDLILEFTLLVTNRNKNITKKNSSNIVLRQNKYFNDVETFTIMLNESISLMKGEICRIGLLLYKQLNVAILYCSNKCYSYNNIKLENINDCNKSNNLPHFAAILASIK